jgi:hypothetical protein
MHDASDHVAAAAGDAAGIADAVAADADASASPVCRSPRHRSWACETSGKETDGSRVLASFSMQTVPWQYR